jgi:prolyl 4-hydroxylase
LNDVSLGGLTSFPKLNYSVKPVCGRATYFRYDYKNEETNMKTLHVGEPPTDGAIKWIATVWIHEKPYKRII